MSCEYCHRSIHRCTCSDLSPTEELSLAKSAAADLERQLDHERTLRKSAEERVAELEVLAYEVREWLRAQPVEALMPVDLLLRLTQAGSKRRELLAALRESVERAERKRGGA